ncbi:MAG TPA: hypothetical protein VMR77_03440 [Patescibacteria group bacterium]|jgi:hypothetical protein|nr:hypothetical protein [Patescibacteria group bacterium]
MNDRLDEMGIPSVVKPDFNNALELLAKMFERGMNVLEEKR